jgi:hypothetical protein
MKRKKFLFISAVAVAAIATPVVYLNRGHKERDKSPEQPWILAQFCSEEEIRKIGNQYRTQVPVEAKKERLLELLLSDDSGKKITPTSNSVSDWLDKKIRQEFNEGKTIVANGWVISVTEARQCALFSMT